MIVPDSIEPYVGYKCLGVLPDGRLRSLAFAYEWPFQERAVAFCGRGLSHAAPDQGCACGIYAATPDEAADYFFSPEVRVMIEVALWGEVVLARKGARGHFAYPQRIVACGHASKRLVNKAAKAYGVPIESFVKTPTEWSDATLSRRIQMLEEFRRQLAVFKEA